ncbi:MAG: hypothetical protein R3A10_21965 [Caldilineaceae bacterium]
MKPTTRWVLLILLFHLALTLAYSMVNPLGEAPDEADHWAYIVHLANERALPVGPRITQSKHPPLYHATAAAVASLGELNDFLRQSRRAISARARLVAQLFIHHTGGHAPAWRRARFIWCALVGAAEHADGRRHLCAGADGVSGLAVAGHWRRPRPWPASPSSLYRGAANNDNAAALFGTLALWGGVAILRGEGRVRWLVDAACSGPGPAVQDEHVGCVACGGRGDCGRRGGGA